MRSNIPRWAGLISSLYPLAPIKLGCATRRCLRNTLTAQDLQLSPALRYTQDARQRSILGLSLTAPWPAAAWYFIYIVCYFSPGRAKNNIQGIENDRQAKVLILYLFGGCFRPGAKTTGMN